MARRITIDELESGRKRLDPSASQEWIVEKDGAVVARITSVTVGDDDAFELDTLLTASEINQISRPPTSSRWLD